MLNYKFIAIEGNIGAGKTSLAKQIATSYNTTLILEQFEENIFLPKFYEDPSKYALPVELSFLADRHQQLKKEVLKDVFKNNVIADYFFLKSMVFASGNLNTEEMELYTNLFTIINESLPKPDLFVYLHQNVENLLINIKKRGRSYEQTIQADYLQKVENNYFDFFKKTNDLRIVIIDISHLDFSNRGENYQHLIKVINKPYDIGITYQTIDINQ